MLNKNIKENMETLQEEIKLVIKPQNDFYSNVEINNKEAYRVIGEYIHYNQRIRFNESNWGNVLPLKPEELVRAKSVQKLVDGGHSMDLIWCEKVVKVGRDGKELDIFVCNSVVFEVKPPNVKWNIDDDNVKSQCYSIAAILSQEPNMQIKMLIYGDDVDCIVIDYVKYPTYDKWINEGKKEVMSRTLPKISNMRITKNELLPINEDKFKSLFDERNGEVYMTIWRGGKVPYPQIHDLIQNIFIAKLYDQEISNDEDFLNVQIFDNELNNPEDAIDRIEKFYKRAFCDLCGCDDDNSDAEKLFNREHISPKDFIDIIQLIQRYRFDNDKTLSKFFEDSYHKSVKHDKGQFLTDPIISKFMSAIVLKPELVSQFIKDNGRVPKIGETSVGSGSMIRSYIKFMNKIIKYDIDNNHFGNNNTITKFKNQFSANNNFWVENGVSGVDISWKLLKTCKLLLKLMDASPSVVSKSNGLITNSSKRKKVTGYDHYVDEEFDYMLLNPPFSCLIDKDGLDLELLKHWSDRSKPSEIMFIEGAYQKLKPNGVTCIIVPESVVDGSTFSYVRDFIIKRFKILSVISLPTATFMPYTSVKTSIIVLQKREYGSPIDENEIIDLYDVNSVGYERTEKAEKLTKNELFEDVENFIEENLNSDKVLGRIWNRQPHARIELKNVLLTEEKRIDVKYLKGLKDENFTLFSELYNINGSKYNESNYEGLSQINYVEIGNIFTNKSTKLVEVNPNEVDLTISENDDLDDEIKDKLKKIKKGTKKFEENCVLIVKTRPELKKIIFTNESYSDYYFTTDIFGFKIIDNSTFDIYDQMSLFKKFINKKLLEVSRNGKGAYNTLTETDILNIKIYDSEMKEFTDMLLTEDYINKKQMFQEGYEMNKISEHKILNSFGGF